MTYPEGVVTRPVTWGIPIEFVGGVNWQIKVSVAPSTPRLVWASTGDIVIAGTATAYGPGESVTIGLPVTDQTGWIDPTTGSSIDPATNPTHTYTASITVLDEDEAVQAQYVSNRFYIPTGDLSELDADLFLTYVGPAGTVVSMPDMWTELVEAAIALAVPGLSIWPTATAVAATVGDSTTDVVLGTVDGWTPKMGDEVVSLNTGSPGIVGIITAITSSTLVTVQTVGSFRGPKGDSDYDIAVSEGFVGNESDWLATLAGYNVNLQDNGDGTVTFVPGPTDPVAAAQAAAEEARDEAQAAAASAETYSATTETLQDAAVAGLIGASGSQTETALNGAYAPGGSAGNLTSDAVTTLAQDAAVPAAQTAAADYLGSDAGVVAAAEAAVSGVGVVLKTDPGAPTVADVGATLVRIDAADGTSTWLQANATDGGPTDYSTSVLKPALGLPASGVMATNDTRIPQIIDTVTGESVRFDMADGTSTWLQANATDGGPTDYALALIAAGLSSGATYGRNLAQAGLEDTTTDIGALIDAQYDLGFRHLIVPYAADPWPNLTTFTVPAGCVLEFEPGARIANNMSGTSGSVIYGTLINPSFTSTAFTVPSSSADAASDDYAYPSRETLFKDGARVWGDYWHEYATTGAHCEGSDIVFVGNVYGKNMRHRTGWAQVFHVDGDAAEASQIFVLGRIYGEDSDRNVEIEDGAHDIHLLGGGYAKNIFPNGYSGQPADTSVGDTAVYANYTFVWDLGHAHDFSGGGGDGLTHAGPSRVIYRGGFVAENCGGAVTCERSVGTAEVTIPRDSSMDELHVIGRGQSTGAQDVTLGGINCSIGRVVFSEGAGIAGGTFRIAELSTGSGNVIGQVTGDSTAMAALTISSSGAGLLTTQTTALS